MGLLRTLIEKLETTGAVDPSVSDELEPITPAMAAAQAAIDEAIRQRQAEDRRDGSVADRRAGDSAGYTGPERRTGDRRKGAGFGRRTRD